jgi:hypothetical protein
MMVRFHLAVSEENFPGSTAEEEALRDHNGVAKVRLVTYEKIAISVQQGRTILKAWFSQTVDCCQMKF